MDPNAQTSLVVFTSTLVAVFSIGLVIYGCRRKRLCCFSRPPSIQPNEASDNASHIE